MKSEISKVIDGLRYDTEKAQVIASNEYWDGSNWERGGRNTHLYRTQAGRYFVVHSTQWQGERTNLEPMTQEEAQALYYELPEQVIDFSEAFPGATVEEA